MIWFGGWLVVVRHRGIGMRTMKDLQQWLTGGVFGMSCCNGLKV